MANACLPRAGEWPAQQRNMDADDNCHMEVATDEVREATQSHASESPVPGEHTDV
jgi:hypothetical protein